MCSPQVRVVGFGVTYEGLKLILSVLQGEEMRPTKARKPVNYVASIYHVTPAARLPAKKRAYEESAPPRGSSAS